MTQSDTNTRRALVLYAHPCPESFNAAVHDTVVGTLKAGGWTVDDCDLNAEGFSPVLSEAERRGYHEAPENLAPVAPYVARLRAADALVLVFPVWNFGYPAILKGFFDRVCLPGVSFELREGKVRPALTNIKQLMACTTYGGTRFRAFLNGDPPRKNVTRALRYACGMPPCHYLPLYDMNRNSAQVRTAHLAHVQQKVERLA
ncbi:NAD(P)H-dependent oxidoreductase [Shimia sp. R11_0]|uniref:NAD(P)H-dependent oxidoreductase n=1 Tax=Shimia sp. R11_0 TaxID=2821096 RepID=UPI001ADA3830|nr:NAD(P)H-dependent oxidoreductase [Shimia sp. R11_0]MBO9479601.1 NAD(P)H-dependent oxidoreductase [Shimia sp. R11_0]